MDAWLPRAARMHPDRTALVTRGQQISYAELEQLALEAAGGLQERGVRRGDRVALALPANRDFAVALHACLLLGTAAVPIDLRLTEAERAVRQAEASLVVDGSLAGAPLRSPIAPEPESIAAVVHTSGTTAAARPVELTYGNWLWSALGSALALGLEPEERWLCPLPLAHVGGLSILIRSAIYGTTAVLHERSHSDALLAALMEAEPRITLVSLVPTQLQRLLDAGLSRPPGLRWALLGGGPIAPALLARAQRAGVPVAPTYGMTEACSQIATQGWPLLGAELRIGSDSELLVRGPIVAPGAIADDGWLHTGDLGAFDDRGRLLIVGRKADTIVSGGENVAPAEVEAVLLSHAAVADAAAHGRADPDWGEAVVATVVLRDGARADPDELLTYCAVHLARFKVPKAIAFAQRLPRTASGKLLRRELG
jgi:O-succinylbenzoic acid--CoA ligase